MIGRLVLPAILLAAAMNGARADEPSLNDIARFLAGMSLPRSSPLAAAAADPALRQYSVSFAAAWAGFERVQIRRIRLWSAKHLPTSPRVVRYIFSGPDFAYANALFPRAETYVFGAVEPVGEIPDLLRLSPPDLAREVACIRRPFSSFQRYGIFVTDQLRVTNEGCEFKGNLPLLLVMLARSGETVRSVELIEINENGETVQRGPTSGADHVHGVRIGFDGKAGRSQLLYYFSVDLSDTGNGASRFLKFSELVGDGATLLKAASYLLHSSKFSKIRNSILEHSSLIVQDDSGVPLKYFDALTWSVDPLGEYRGPISMFSSFYQPDMHALFRNASRHPIDFGFGYRWRASEANVLLLKRKRPP